MSSNSSSTVRLENAGIQRDGKWLVRGVTMDVKSREIVTMIGPNGSGKSTTAKMALGILKPDEGTVYRAEDVRISYVPQKIDVDWTLPLKVERFMRLTSPISVSQMDDALASTGASHLKNSNVRSLSGGEFQRVMLARAIARKPSLLVLDEPVQGVDFAGEIEIYNLIKSIRDQLGCAVLLISHDLHVVMAATDHVVCFNGHVCCQGTPTGVASSQAYKDLFGARANPALALYQHQHDHTHMPDGRVMHADGSITDHCHEDDGHNHDHKHGDRSRAG